MKRTLSLSLVALFATGALAACDKEAGRKQETIGKVESGVGEIVGDKDLKKEGQKDKVALSGTMVDAASPTGRSFDLELSFLADGFSLSVRDQVKEAKVDVMRQTFSKKAIETTQEPVDRKK
jgi:ABC-type proline/glycine betaine transport system substrate-binding protein